ncbi:MAG TPA: ABC transporter permease, partial [Thermoanaerobaculia bacterium]|nr:ABC transporter permease [Thermoanaerobaculia bacterium]
MKSLAQDLRYAVRLLLKSPGFTLLAAITLALGIGANAAIFSIVNSVLLRPLPYQAPDRLMIVYSQFPTMNFDRFWVDPMEYWEYSQKNRSFEKLGAYVTGAVNVSGGEEPVRADAALASAGLFEALGVDAQLGRYYGAAEDLPNGEKVTVLSDGLWRRAFGADRGILGRRIKVDGADRTVIGVMPPGFALGNERIDVWIPLALDPASPGFRGNHYLYLVGRLKPGVSLAQARSELNGLVARWELEIPDNHTPEPEGHPLIIQPFLEDLVGDVRPKIQLLMGAVGLVLLIACANVANLLLARAEARQKEIAVRTALGADRGRLVRQFLTESVVLSLFGGVLGLVLAYWGVRAIVVANLESIPRVDEIGLDGRALLFTLGISLLTGLLFGLAPALHARTGAFFASLKEGGQRTTASGGRLLLRRALVVTEVALAAMLVIGGGLLIRSFWLLTQVDPGFDPKGLLSLQIALPDATYPDDNQVNAFYTRLVDRLKQLPGVEGAAAVSGLPPNRQVNANDTEFEGVPEPPNGPIHNVDYWQFVTRDYFHTMGIPVLEGRAFTPSDARGTPGVVLVNQTLANLFWPGQSPLGKRVKAPGGPNAEAPWLTVVGVVKDVKQGGLDKKTGTELYFLTDQSPDTVGAAADTMYLMLRTEGDPLRLVDSVREEIRRLDPALPLADVRPMTDVIFASVAQPRFVAFMVLVFAIVALALAAIGTYGVLAYTVEQRTQEIGVRMALGAQARQVLGMILAQGAWLVGLGLVLGVAGSLALRKVLASVLFGVTPTDPVILGTVVLVLSAVAFAACYLPARRATRVSPLVA